MRHQDAKPCEAFDHGPTHAGLHQSRKDDTFCSMDQSEDEEILGGGNINTVVRVGDTVRRHVSAQSETIHALLLHLEAQGVPAPRFMGIDAKGREILGFINGETASPQDMWEGDAAVVASAKLLHRFHDATLDFEPATGAVWAYTYPDKDRHEVICHNDFAPYNMVFHDGVPISPIDFDLCGPGPRTRDLAYLAYWMTPLSFAGGDMTSASERDLETGSRRLKLLCETYGTDAAAVLRMVPEVLHHMSSEDAARDMVGEDAAMRLKEGGHFEHWAREAAAFERKLDTLIQNTD